MYVSLMPLWQEEAPAPALKHMEAASESGSKWRLEGSKLEPPQAEQTAGRPAKAAAC